MPNDTLQKLLALALETDSEGEALAAFQALRRKPKAERKTLNTVQAREDTSAEQIKLMMDRAYNNGVEAGWDKAYREYYQTRYQTGFKQGKIQADSELYYKGKREGYEQGKREGMVQADGEEAKPTSKTWTDGNELFKHFYDRGMLYNFGKPQRTGLIGETVLPRVDDKEKD
jgi:flagellar biosynthesis/type III secretory pathway protein FliH